VRSYAETVTITSLLTEVISLTPLETAATSWTTMTVPEGSSDDIEGSPVGAHGPVFTLDQTTKRNRVALRSFQPPHPPSITNAIISQEVLTPDPASPEYVHLFALHQNEYAEDRGYFFNPSKSSESKQTGYSILVRCTRTITFVSKMTLTFTVAPPTYTYTLPKVRMTTLTTTVYRAGSDVSGAVTERRVSTTIYAPSMLEKMKTSSDEGEEGEL
jgi:hypothetical protein